MKHFYKPVTLITFDVDGTLVEGSAAAPDVTAHAKAFLYAVGKVLLNDLDFHQRHESPLDFLAVEQYSGQTDGLILLNLVKRVFSTHPYSSHEAASSVDIKEIVARLPELFNEMYEYMARHTDEEIALSTVAIPGVLSTLEALKTSPEYQNGQILCGLVTGNVEGIARRKMRASGIFSTQVLSKSAAEQTWHTDHDLAFLGGFGSDFCSGNIEDPASSYQDRGQQIAIAYNRAKTLLASINPEDVPKKIVRVIHVGDAPSDVLAAKWCAENNKFLTDHADDPTVITGCIGVATGRFSVERLNKLAGDTIEGVWEPVVLQAGLGDEMFVRHCTTSHRNP